jgi:hypothetical protein
MRLDEKNLKYAKLTETAGVKHLHRLHPKQDVRIYQKKRPNFDFF